MSNKQNKKNSALTDNSNHQEISFDFDRLTYSDYSFRRSLDKP